MTQTAKDALIHDLEENVGEFLTFKHTRMVSDALGNVLTDYDVEQVSAAKVNTDLLKLFINAKTVEGKSPKTTARYEYVLEKAIFGIGKPIENITVNDIRTWFSAEKDRGISDRSLDGARSVCSSFFGWLFRESLIKQNPMNNFSKIKYRKEIRLPFSNVEMERIKRSCKNTRDLTIVHFLRSTGCRIGEVERLNRCDIDVERHCGTVIGKGDKPRKIYFDDITAECLKEYLGSRTDSDSALFVGRGTSRVTQQAIRKMLTKIGTDANVENVHPHRFRRTLATHLAELGMPVQQIAAILGHENINTTMKYITVNDTMVEGDYRRYM